MWPQRKGLFNKEAPTYKSGSHRITNYFLGATGGTIGGAAGAVTP